LKLDHNEKWRLDNMTYEPNVNVHLILHNCNYDIIKHC
jgi:hypothetical protein